MTEIGGHTYEQAQTYRAAIFDLVCHPLDWKLPVAACIKYTPALHDAVIDAVIHFTGSVPTIKIHEEGSIKIMEVRAAGYYTTMGG